MLCTLLAACAALSPAAPALAGKPPRLPQRFTSTGLAPALAEASGGPVRVLIALRAQPAATAALRPELRDALAGRLDEDQLHALRTRRPGADALIAADRQAERAQALDELQPAADRAAGLQRDLLAALAAAGATVAERDVLANTVTATVPHAALAALAARADVRAIAPAPLSLPQSILQTSTAAIGAPAFWAAGFTGGQGPNDVNRGVDLAIINDKIQEDHPSFAGIAFQRPSDAPVNTACAAGTAGCEHGTSVASMAVSRGASGCPTCTTGDETKKGIAPGLDTVLDADVTLGVSGAVWALGVTQAGIAGAADPAEVMSDSHGSFAPGVDDSEPMRGTDKFVSSYGTLLAKPAGNSGPAQNVESECIAYDTLCLGAFNPVSTVDPADDVIPDFSSRGPTPAGRKKPDLVGVGVSEYANQRWSEAAQPLWRAGTGTSLAAPQGAGAAALLAGTGISDPLAQKAILIDSARPGRSTPTSAMGTQTGWQPDWGFGALDLEAALAERSNFHTAGVGASRVRFYSATVAAAGDRATLVWNRRATGCLGPGCTATALTLTDLDLEQRDATTGALQSSSASTIDNVEQVRAVAAGDVVYAVSARSSAIDGLPAEPYALATRRVLTPLATPEPTTALALSSTTSAPGEVVTVQARLVNPSPDLSAENLEVRLELPAGVALAVGSPAATQALGTLTASGEVTVTWTVTGTGDGLRALTARSSASRYGASFTSADTAMLTVATPAPPVPTSHPLPEAAPTPSPAPVAPSLSPLTPVAPAPQPVAPTADRPPSPLPVARSRHQAARVAIAQAVVREGTLRLAGTLRKEATGLITLTYGAKVGGRTVTARWRALVRKGRFRAVLRLPPTLRRATGGTLTATYAGDRRHRRQTVRRAVRRAR